MPFSMQRRASLGVQRNSKQAEEQIRLEATCAETLVRSASRLNARLETNAVLHTVCEEAAHALNVAAATVSPYDAERDTIYYAHRVGYPSELIQRAKPTPRSVHDDLARQLGPLIVIPDLKAVPGLPDADLYAKPGVRTTINADIPSLPVVSDDGLSAEGPESGVGMEGNGSQRHELHQIPPPSVPSLRP